MSHEQEQSLCSYKNVDKQLINWVSRFTSQSVHRVWPIFPLLYCTAD